MELSQEDAHFVWRRKKHTPSYRKGGAGSELSLLSHCMVWLNFHCSEKEDAYVFQHGACHYYMHNARTEKEGLGTRWLALVYTSQSCLQWSPLFNIPCSERWYGLLFSQTSNSKKANLVLCVLYPNAELPWLGQMSYLGSKTQDVGDPRVQTDIYRFPVGPSHLPSFHTPSNLFWAKESVLQV